MDAIELYRRMARARAFEVVTAELWRQGRISGEMHLGTGEEAVAAGVTAHLRPGDAVALDHRPSPVLVAVGVDPVRILREMLGRDDGLCRGRGGHMHLFSPEHLAASSGIVGASGPLAAGFALAARTLRSGSVAVCTFGDGAMNQGMLLESMNLAAAWRLPLLFVCKDNGWAITTRSQAVTGGALPDRARAFGLESREVDGLDAAAVHLAAGQLLDRIRKGKGPAFLLARCSRLDGHFLGDLTVRMGAHPVAEGREVFGRVVSSAMTGGGAGIGARAAGMLKTLNMLRLTRKEKRDGKNDPLQHARKSLREDEEALDRIDDEAQVEMSSAAERALAEGDAS